MSTGPRAQDSAFQGVRRLPWQKSLGLSAVLAGWERDGVRREITLDETFPATPAQMAPMPDALHPGIVRALRGRGVEQLYSHQARAVELGLAGEDFVVATPTASGKSLCYNLPVLQRLATEPGARALYLFPTKALSRDQEHALRALMTDAEIEAGAITFDGDTPGDARRAAKERAGVILTNPDMLHAGVLPHHANWARLFANLRVVVIDELHTYRGVFGSHLANVLRRLQRVAHFHGSDPTFIMASATIGNPGEHGARMIGRPVEVLSESGAPTGPRRVMVYNPPVLNAELGIRQSYLKAAVRLTTDLIRAEVPTLVFGQSRNGVEVMLKYLRDRLKGEVDPSTLLAYRGGYLPNQRRAIEAGLREGDVRCVVATNALELGIDIGGLDAVVCAGYPGTIAGLWQRLGRAGRREAPALGVMVASSAPLDQYIATNSAGLLSAPVEQARIDPDNVEILVQHIKCAAFELPFEEGDRFGDLESASLEDTLGFLAHHGMVHPAPDATGKLVHYWASDAYPANGVSLRSIGWDNFVIVDLDTDLTIAEMDWRSTHTMLHEQAIYQHDAAQFQVERLDYENHKAFVRRVKPDYYTTAMTHLKVTVTEEEDAAPLTPLAAGAGEVSVIEKVVGYKKIKFHTHENVGYGDVHLPEMQMHTSAFWLTFPEPVIGAFMAEQMVTRPPILDALRGLLSAMHLVAATGLMVDPRDLGRCMGDRTDPDAPLSFSGAERSPRPPRSESSQGPTPTTPRFAREPHADFVSAGPLSGGRGGGGSGGAGFDPTLFLFDYVAGGIGLAPRLFDEREVLLRRTRQAIDGCRCEDGCPACIGASAPETPQVSSLSRRALLSSLLDHVGLPCVH